MGRFNKGHPLARSELRIAADNDTGDLHPVPPAPRRRWPLFLRIVSWLYLLLLVLAWICLWAWADRHWSGTLIEFAPRWGLLIPIPLIALVALVSDRHLFWPAGLALLVGLGPLTGLSLPLPWRLSAGLSPPIRVMTLNTDGRARAEDVVALAESAKVDVVCLQEAYRPDNWAQHFGPDWDVRYQDEFVVASRYRISVLEPLTSQDAAWDRCAVRCQLQTPHGVIRLVNLHTHSLRNGLEAVLHHDPKGFAELDKYVQRRNRESEHITQWIRDADGPVILAGDFNMAAGTLAYDEHWGRYLNAYSDSGYGWGATFHSRWHGVRIDHVLASRDFQAMDCWVGHDVGSAHRPVIATLQLVR
jgi:endonuclease/exonuclease/phosphatase family metal-dependent hydrolase